MTKAVRQMQEDIKLIDLIIEIADARIPISSRNPDIDKLAGNKPRLVLLNKSDLSDPKINDLFIEDFKKKGVYALKIDSKNKEGFKKITEEVKKACAEKIERDKKKGIKNRPLRAMVVGIPNVGKSTFINAFTGSAGAKTGNKPGVTKGKQWIRLNKDIELLDTPGILWPKFESEEIGRNLALIGSINDDILDQTELASFGIDFLRENYPDLLKERYKIELDENKKSYELLEEIAVLRNYLVKGGNGDTLRMAGVFMEEFRNGKIGRFSLERP